MGKLKHSEWDIGVLSKPNFLYLLLEYAPRQIEQYLVPPVFLDGHLEQLRVLNADTAKREVSPENLDVVLGKLHRT